jgi:cobyrinic acid a,c-diamide synthase
VIDVRGQGASVAALAEGFINHRPDVAVVGVILNRVAGPSHERLLSAALADRSIEVLGAVPRSEGLSLPSRHLGLVQAGEGGRASLTAILARASAVIEEGVDIDALLDRARPIDAVSGAPDRSAIPPLGGRIALARDEAFGFCYDALLDDWRAQGAAIIPFSPLADEAPDDEADAVYLPGGYPELHAGRLAGNEHFLDGLRRAASGGAAVFGECGGYMALGRVLIDADGAAHRMADLLPLETSFRDRRLTLGYRHARLAQDGLLGEAGTRYAGHEFHYCRVISEAVEAPLFETTDAVGADLGPAGLVVGNVFGSFVHLIDQVL